MLINWVKAVFPEYRKEMKGLAWGELYNQFNKEKFDSAEMEKQITALMMDDDVTKKSGIVPAVCDVFAVAIKEHEVFQQPQKCGWSAVDRFRGQFQEWEGAAATALPKRLT